MKTHNLPMQIWDNIHSQYQIYKVLFDIAEDNLDNWTQMNSDELIRQVMIRTRGTINPKTISDTIKDIEKGRRK